MTMRNLNLAKSRGRILGTPKVGKLASLVPSTGQHGPAYLYPSLDATDVGLEVCGTVTVMPTLGILTGNELTGFLFDATGVPDGPYFFLFQPKRDGIKVGAPKTVTLTVGNGVTIACTVGNIAVNGLTAAVTQSGSTAISCSVGNIAVAGKNATVSTIADSTVPVMNGVITTVATTPTSISISWIAASDNVGVAGYKVSNSNGVSYLDIGMSLAYTFSPLSSSAVYLIKVAAYDAAGNISLPLSATISTDAAPDIEPPTQIGSLAHTETPTTITLDWSGVTAFDNDGVAGFEYRIGGTGPYTPATPTEESLKLHVFTGLTPGAAYQIDERARDTSGLTSTPLTLTVTTPEVIVPATHVTVSLADRGGSIQANFTNLEWAFFDQAQPHLLTAPVAKGSAASSNSSGLLTVSIVGTALPVDAVGWLIVSNSNGDPTQSNQIAFTGPVVTA